MSQENVDAVQRALDGWNRDDLDAWLGSSHSEIEWYSAIAGQFEGTETVYRGHEGVRQFWDEWHSLWDLKVDLMEIRDLGDTVLALGRMRTRGHASGVDLESPVGYVFEFEGGLMRRVRAYLDDKRALEAVGLAE